VYAISFLLKTDLEEKESTSRTDIRTGRPGCAQLPDTGKKTHASPQKHHRHAQRHHNACIKLKAA